VRDDAPPPAGDTREALRQAAICGLAFGIYFGGRRLVEGSSTTGLRNADRTLAFERALHIDVERGLQDVVLRSAALQSIGNLAYVWLHWPVVIASLVVLLVRDRSRFLRLRNGLIASGLVGLLLFWSFPEAPPRLLEGYTGTVSDAARRLYLGIPMSWSDRFASFPSFHVGWTMIACLSVAATVRRPWVRALTVLPAVLVTVAVISTANHFVVDAVAGAAIAGAAYLLADGSTRADLLRRLRREPGSRADSPIADESAGRSRVQRSRDQRP
jgi:hypothetical protein